MNQRDGVLDPEIAALVREVVQDPDSTLLRMTPAQRRAAIYEHDPRPGAISAQLSANERLLYAAYREDVAGFLLNAAARSIVDDPVWSNVIFFHTAPDEVWIPPATGELLVDRIRLLDESLSRGESEERICFLRRSLQPARADAPSTTELAGASLRLAPSQEARIYLGLGQVQERRNLEAKHCFARVTRESVSEIISAYAWTDLGHCAFQLGDTLGARDAHRRAIEHDPSSSLSHFCLLYLALLQEDLPEVIRVGRMVDAVVREGSPTLAQLLRAIDRRRNDPSHSLRIQRRDSILAVISGLGVVSRQIADALLALPADGPGIELGGTAPPVSRLRAPREDRALATLQR